MNNKILSKRIRTCLLIIFFLFSVSVSIPVEAASKGATAKKAYALLLINKDSACKFALIDINKDSAPEMLFTEDNGYHVKILSYRNGKVKSIGWGFAGTQAFYPNKGIYYSLTVHGGIDERYSIFDGKKMMEVAAYSNSDELGLPENSTYRIGQEVVTKEQYDEYVKALMDGATKQKVTYYKNTVSNIKKYLGYSPKAYEVAFKRILTNENTVSNWHGEGSYAELNNLRFVCFKVGNNKVPILVIKNPKATLYGKYNIYQFINGKAKYLCSIDKINYIYQDSGVIVTSNKGGVGMNSFTDTTYYQVGSKSKTGKSIASSRVWSTADSYLVDEYRLKNRNVTSAEFNRWITSVTNGKKVQITGKQFNKNTQKNRNKYLK